MVENGPYSGGAFLGVNDTWTIVRRSTIEPPAVLGNFGMLGFTQTMLVVPPFEYLAAIQLKDSEVQLYVITGFSLLIILYIATSLFYYLQEHALPGPKHLSLSRSLLLGVYVTYLT